MSRRPSIADAMREAGGGIRAVPQAMSVQAAPTPTETPLLPGMPEAPQKPQPSRQGTKAITGHFPPNVRYQLKLLAAEQNRTMEDMLAEALNRLFAAYNKPEIAPTGTGGVP